MAKGITARQLWWLMGKSLLTGSTRGFFYRFGDFLNRCW
jgi:hypothetical protein